MADGHYLSPEFLEELNELVRWWRVRKDDRPLPAEKSKRGAQSDVAVMLLEDLESGQLAKATVLEGEPYRNATLLTVFGEPAAADTFQLTWQKDDDSDPETVTGISKFATPAELTERLREFSFVNSRNLTVQLGNHTRVVDGETVAYNTYRWLIEVTDRLLAAPLMVPETDGSSSSQSWMGAEKTLARDTGRLLDVLSLLPVGVDVSNNTPMQAGAIAIVAEVLSFGWAVHAVEARHLSTDFVEVAEVSY